jgi:outer membrane protein assembly factor BamE (lipoprotein component of BamABCDE complex)
MKTSLRYLVLLVALPFLGACSSAVTASQLTQVTTGMKTDQVQKILGQPTRIDQSEITGLSGQVYHYVSSAGDGQVVFVNDAVFETNFVPAGAHA